MKNRNYFASSNGNFNRANYNSLPKRNVIYGNNKREEEKPRYYFRDNPEERDNIGGLLPIRVAYNSLLGSFIKNYNQAMGRNYGKNYGRNYDSARGYMGNSRFYGQNSRNYAGGLRNTYSSGSSGKGVSALKGISAKKAA